MATANTGNISSSGTSTDLQGEEAVTNENCDPVSESGEKLSMTEQHESIVELGDVKFKVEDQIIHANKASLSLQSMVFHAMFTDDFKEKSMDVIPLPGKSAAGFIQFIDVTHRCVPVNSENVYAVLLIASEYQCESVLLHCDNFLLQQEFHVLNLAVSGQYKLDKSLKKFTQAAIEKDITDLKMDEHFDQVPEYVKLEIYDLILQRKQTALSYVTAEMEALTVKCQELKPYKEKLTQLTTGLQSHKWSHSRLCVRAFIKKGKCTCRAITCDHRLNQKAIESLCKEPYNPSGQKKNYFTFLQYPFCSECAVQTLWHVLECFNN